MGIGYNWNTYWEAMIIIKGKMFKDINVQMFEVYVEVDYEYRGKKGRFVYREIAFGY